MPRVFGVRISQPTGGVDERSVSLRGPDRPTKHARRRARAGRRAGRGRLPRPACSAAAIRDVNRPSVASGRVTAVSSIHVTRARSNSPRSSWLTSRSSGTTTSGRPLLDREPGSGEQTSAAAGRLAEFGRASHRGDRDLDRAPLLGPRSCLFELKRDVLVLAGQQSRAVPRTSVGLIREHVRQCLMGTPTVAQARALRDRRANERMPEADRLQVDVDDPPPRRPARATSRSSVVPATALAA